MDEIKPRWDEIRVCGSKVKNEQSNHIVESYLNRQEEQDNDEEKYGFEIVPFWSPLVVVGLISVKITNERAFVSLQSFKVRMVFHIVSKVYIFSMSVEL